MVFLHLFEINKRNRDSKDAIVETRDTSKKQGDNEI